jgi:hypothetical protein
MSKKIISKPRKNDVYIITDPGQAVHVHLVSGLGVKAPPPGKKGKPPISLDLREGRELVTNYSMELGVTSPPPGKRGKPPAPIVLPEKGKKASTTMAKTVRKAVVKKKK